MNPRTAPTHRRFPMILAVLASACAAVASAGCNSTAGNNPLIEITVDVDPALGLDHVAVDVQGGQRPPLDRTFAVSASGTPSTVAPVTWEVVVSNLSAPFEALVTATGQKGTNNAVVNAIGGANVVSGQRVSVTLMLTAACAGKSCPTGQSCANGTCGMIIVTGPSLDGGVRDGGGGGAGGKAGVGGKAGAGGRGGNGGASSSVDAHPDRPGDAGAGGETGDAGGDSGPTKLPTGHTCSLGTDCDSGYCAQGICCKTACTATCYACANTLTGQADGTCAVVSSDKDDPAGGCTAGASTTCGNTGHCDGNGACEKLGSTTVCVSSSCGTSGFTANSVCDGKGNCMQGATTNCMGFSCSNTTGCATSCSADTDCPGGYCTSAMTCTATLSDGANCNKNSQCTNGNCISGICCHTACSGTCLTCATGLCKPVAAGGSSGGACAVDSAACGHDGNCDGNGGCRYQPSTVSCGTTACSGGKLTAIGTCNGGGGCTPGATAACPNNVAVCAGNTACKTTCSADTDCASGYYCSGGSCIVKKTNGTTCGATHECGSTFCSPDGVCCDQACTNSCQACDNTGSVGICSPVQSGPVHGNRTTCQGTGTCAGSCAGLASGLCSYPTSTCSAATCSSQQIVPAGTCNAGSCVTPAAQNCAGGFLCSGGACSASCSTSAGCLADYFCYANACHSDVVSISAGGEDTCAALKDGRVFCWGMQSSGGLGNGSTASDDALVPVQAGTFTDAVVVSAGQGATYALTTSGTLRAWGQGESGEMGNGASAAIQSTPVMVETAAATPLTGVTHIVAGDQLACATTAGGVYCWGNNGGHGLGVDPVTSATAKNILYASPVMGISSAPDFFGGQGFHLTANGQTVCPWDAGNNSNDVTGGTCNVACYSAPSNCFSVGSQVEMLAAGADYACVLAGLGVLCWGDNDLGACGEPDTTLSVPPTGNFIGLSPLLDMQSYGSGVCVLMNDGVPTLRCWGLPFSYGPTGSPPVTITTSFPAGVRAKFLGTGNGATACVVTDEGSPWCFGFNSNGAFGNGTEGNNSQTPLEVTVNW